MKEISFLNSSPVYLEIGRDVLRAAQDASRAELPLERTADGKLTEECRDRIAGGLRAFVARKTFQGRARAYCGIAADGVSLRRLTIPATAKDKFDQVLRLQIEAEFPLAPDELAWGYQVLPAKSAASQEVLVAVSAVKREVIEEYREFLAACGLDAVFTLAALARNFVCPDSQGTHALLDIGTQRAELILFEQGVATLIRSLPLGNEAALPEMIARAAGAKSNRGKIYVSGTAAGQVARIASRLGTEGVPFAMDAGTSVAILGLKNCVERQRTAHLLLLQNRVRPAAGRFNTGSPELKPWLAAAAILIGLLLLLPLAEAIVLKPFLSRKLAALQAEKGRLATIDHELDFLQSLKRNQPPYLDALFVLAKSAPPGTRFDALTMDKRGEISFHGMMQNGMQVTDFRSKLIATGFFSIVTVEEQTPAPDRQHVSVRMTALWKPADARAGLNIGPTAEEIKQAKTNKDNGGGGGMPPGMMFQ